MERAQGGSMHAAAARSAALSRAAGASVQKRRGRRKLGRWRRARQARACVRWRDRRDYTGDVDGGGEGGGSEGGGAVSGSEGGGGDRR